jgi:hypothetical protein
LFVLLDIHIFKYKKEKGGKNHARGTDEFDISLNGLLPGVTVSAATRIQDHGDTIPEAHAAEAPSILVGVLGGDRTGWDDKDKGWVAQAQG